ncbi:MAG: hypothetical protein AAF721_41970, partial [Myxococcota bacterium]
MNQAAVRPPRVAIAGGVLLAGLTACSSGAAGESVRPEAPTATQATGESLACAAAGKRAAPLVLDWSAEVRTDLEIAMKSGVVVLRYECEQLEILPDCRLPGEYRFAGVTRKEEVIRLDSVDEIRASLPASAAKLEAELQSGASLELAMVTVGKASAGWRAASEDDLRASSGCGGATHFVRAVSLGAFSMAQASRGKVAASVKVGGAGAGAASTSSRSALRRDGDLAACDGAASEATSAPSQCGASIRLDLRPIEPAGASLRDPVGPEPVAALCPAGMVHAAGRCTLAKPPTHVCAPDDAADCKQQCDAGEMTSCYHLGLLAVDFTPKGLSGAGEQVEAKAALGRACDGGIADACFAQAQVIYGEAHGQGLSTQRTAATAANEVAGRGCDAGSGDACAFQSFLAGPSGMLPDGGRHGTLARRACDLGAGLGCLLLAESYL